MLYQLSEGKASELSALLTLNIIDFYRLLDSHIKNYKPPVK